MKKPIALVTGGSRGIGAATCRALARDGFHVLFTYNTAHKEADQLAQEIGGKAYKVELLNDTEITAVMDLIHEENGKLSLFIFNAGIGELESLTSLTKFTFEKTLQVNLWAAMLCTQKAVGFMEEGSILFTSSVCAQRPTPDALSYAVSKAGLESFAKSIAGELAPKIRVNVVAPGATTTDMMKRNYSAADLEWIEQHYPMKNPCDPKDIAEMFAYLASEKARNITGQIFTIDAGSSLC